MRRISWRLLKPTNLLVLVVLAFIVISLIVLPLFKLYTYPLVSLYQPGRCTITSKELQVSGGTEADPTYHAQLDYTVRTASGAQAHSTRYDWFDGTGLFGMPLQTGSTDRAGEQTILNRYVVGSTYPCWYDARDPSQAVLTRDEDWIRLLYANPLFTIIALVVALVALALILIVVAGLARLAWQGWLAITGQPQPMPPVRHKPSGASGPRSRWSACRECCRSAIPKTNRLLCAL